MKNKIRLVS